MAEAKVSVASAQKDAAATTRADGSGAAGESKRAEEPGISDDAKAAGAKSWTNLLALDSQVFEQKGVRLLTPEARVLIHLKLNGTMTVSTAMEKAGVSYRGFYTVLERLKQAGLVGQVKDKQDQRVRQLRLDPSMTIPPDRL